MASFAGFGRFTRLPHKTRRTGLPVVTISGSSLPSYKDSLTQNYGRGVPQKGEAAMRRVLLVVAALGAFTVFGVLVPASGVGTQEKNYVSVRIIAYPHADGRVELGWQYLQPHGIWAGQRLPVDRHLPADAPVGEWWATSEVRVIAPAPVPLETPPATPEAPEAEPAAATVDEVEFPDLPEWVAGLASDYPYTHQVGVARVHSDISAEFSASHAVMLDRVFGFFDDLYAHNRGPLVEAFYTRDETVFAKVVPHCPTVFIPGARNLVGCYGDIARWFIIPWQIPDYGTLLHEIGHDFLYATFPDYVGATWYVEGTAMYFESGEFDEAEDLVVTEPLDYCTSLYDRAAAEGELIPLAELLWMPRMDFYANNESTYSQSCMLFHYLADAHPGTLDTLIGVINTAVVTSNEQLVAALVDSVGRPLAQLESEFRTWAAENPY